MAVFTFEERVGKVPLQSVVIELAHDVQGDGRTQEESEREEAVYSFGCPLGKTLGIKKHHRQALCAWQWLSVCTRDTLRSEMATPRSPCVRERVLVGK